eukprot:5965215-Karenia_brevis.AAC.1
MSRLKKTLHRRAIDDLVKALEEISDQIHTATPIAIVGLMAQLDVIQEEMQQLRRLADEDAAECAADEVQHV